MTAAPVPGPARSEEALAGLRFEVPEQLAFPAPEAGPDTAFFWSSGQDGRLRIMTCGDCGYLTHPPSPRCAKCLSSNVAPQPVSGRGTVYSYTISVQAFMPGLNPYCVALVELDEQSDVRLTTQLVDCTSDGIEIGMPVEVLFVRGTGDVLVPLFRPVPA